MKKIILITGGQRSGKSLFAEQLALKLSNKPTYVATARILDDDFRKRVEVHKARRTDNWENIEEEKNISCHCFTGKTVLIDCLTLWSTNFFFDNNCNVQTSLNEIKNELDKLFCQDATFVIVTNEVGLGGVSANQMARLFTDLLGSVNQYVAKIADEVFLSISGIQIKIK